MVERLFLPEGLAQMPPGPELATVLAGLDRSRLSGADLVTVMQAQARQVAHDQERLLADMYEVALACQPGPGDPVRGDPVRGDPVRLEHLQWASMEISAALWLTRTAADNQLGLAVGLAQLSAVARALSAGRIDLARAKVIVDEVSVLPDRAARMVAEAAVDLAQRMTTGRLREHLAAWVLKIDPQAARKRYRQGVEGRKVVHGRNRDGTAYLSGCDLPPDLAAAAYQRVNAIAQELKRLGDPRTLDQLRAEVYLDLLADHDHTADGDPAVGDAPAAQSDRAAETDRTDPVPNAGTAPCTTGASRTAAAGRSGVVDLVVSLPTLMGLCDEPGVVPGWGPVLADIARQIATHPRQTWRFSVLDGHGRLLERGRIRARPAQPVRSVGQEYAFVKARDRRCRFPTCRVPSQQCDVDHTRQRQHGGSHVRANLACLCRHHHRGKDEGGFQLTQLDAGTLRWTTRLGHEYITDPEEPPF